MHCFYTFLLTNCLLKLSYCKKSNAPSKYSTTREQQFSKKIRIYIIFKLDNLFFSKVSLRRILQQELPETSMCPFRENEESNSEGVIEEAGGVE